MKDKTYGYSFSDEMPVLGGILLLSETPVALSYMTPIKLERPSGEVLYLDFYPRQPHASIVGREIKYEEDPDLMYVIQRLVNGGDSGSEEALARLRESSRAVTEKAQNIVGPITGTIDKIFSDAGVSLDGAYDSTDIKKVSGKNAVPDMVKFWDQNTKAFIKSHRIFGGLAFLREQTKRLAYGIGFNKFTKHAEGQKKLIEVVFYPSRLYWHHKASSQIDRAGILVNKLIECLLLLVTNLSSSAALVEFYRELNEKVSLSLKSDVLVRLVEALVQHKEVSLLDPAIKQLRSLEPHHPAIESAERAIRRAKIFAEIGDDVRSSVTNIQDLSGLEFEQFLADKFRKYGFQVTLTKSSGDYGADILVEAPSGTKAAVQAKRFKSKVNLKAVQEVVASIPHYAVDFGIVIAASGFFPSAVELAKTNQVELWDDDKLYRFLSGDWSFSMLAET